MRNIQIIAWFMAMMVNAGAVVYEVGTNKTYTSIGAVPWATLTAGDEVLIYWRTNAYHEKWVICRQGSDGSPITVRGVANEMGERPVIDGRNASTPAPLNFWNESRGVLKIGGANTPSDTLPSYIVIEGLEIRSGRPPYTFTNDGGGTEAYSSNAAAVYIEKGAHIIIRDCVLHDCGNGIFAGAYGGSSTNFLIEYCSIYDNGITNRIYEHNNYTEVSGITFQYNTFGPLRQGCGGNNLKDRSAGLVVRYNTMVGGNRQLDLVDTDYAALYQMPFYSNTYVYGNILVEHTNDGNSQIVHYGGDSGATERYRKGKLHFFNNTVVSKRSGNTTLFRLSTNDEHADCYNNILYVTDSGSRLAMLSGNGVLNLQCNWMKADWVAVHGTLYGTINNLGGEVNGTYPGFLNLDDDAYSLTNGSSCIDSGTNLPAVLIPDFDGVDRPLDGDTNGMAIVDLGAFEFANPAADTDGDRQNDWDESVAGTSPTNPLSRFGIDAITITPGVEVKVLWSSVDSRLYDVQYTDKLDVPDWSNIITAVQGSGGQESVTDTYAAIRRIYRLKVRKEP